LGGPQKGARLGPGAKVGVWVKKVPVSPRGAAQGFRGGKARREGISPRGAQRRRTKGRKKTPPKGNPNLAESSLPTRGVGELPPQGVFSPQSKGY